MEGVANTEQAQEEELPQESLRQQQTRQPPSCLSYYLPGAQVYCEQVSSNQPPSETDGFGNHVWSNPYSNNRYPVSQNIQQSNMDNMYNGYGENWQFNHGHHHYGILPHHSTSFSHNSRSMMYPSFWNGTWLLAGTTTTHCWIVIGTWTSYTTAELCDVSVTERLFIQSSGLGF